jgi:hypothetical protein
MMPTAAHFAGQQGAYPAQIPLQHQRPMMNGVPPGSHPNFSALQHNQNAAMAQAHIRQLQQQQQQNGGMGPVGPAAFPPQMPQQMHPQQQMQQMQQMQQRFQQQQNPAMRVVPPQHLIQQQPVAGPSMQHMAAPQQIGSR